MPISVLSQGLFIVSFATIPHPMQRGLHSPAPSPTSRLQFILHSKLNPLAIHLPHGLSTHFEGMFARASYSLSISPSESRVSENAEKQEFHTSSESSDRLQMEDFGMARRVFSVALLCSGLVIAAPALAVPEKKIKGKKSPFDEQRLLEQNKRMQMLNSAPSDFPGFVREGYNVKLVTTGDYVRCKSGLVYLEIQEGQGDYPKDGQQVVFHYVGYNESGRKVDSSYQQGQPAKTRIGINAMIPGFEEGLRTMKPGGKRRLIIPPELGPPVGPSTFFSAKQFEVFDVELIAAKDCTRRTIGFYSDFVCD